MTLQDQAARSERARRAGSAPRIPRAAVDISHPDRVMTIPEWCELNGFSTATGYRILNRGDGPPVVQLSIRRNGIRVSDNARWQESRVRASTSPEAA